MDPQTLAQQIVSLLAPFLPYLLKGTKLAGKKAAETLGEESIKTLWAKLQPHAKVRRAAEAAADLPDNPAMQNALAHEIEGALRADPTLAAEVADLFTTIQAHVRTGEVSGGKVTGVRAKGTPSSRISADVETGDVSGGEVTGVEYEG